MDFAEPLQAVVPGATGRVLGVLVNTSRPLSGRAIAELAGVSTAQAARVLAALTGLGIVSAESAPPANLYRFDPDHVAAGPLVALQHSGDRFVASLAERLARLDPSPVSVVAFGSFARGQASVDSDIDLLVVRPAEVDQDSDAWGDTVEVIRSHARRTSGNPVDILDVGEDEVPSRLRGGGQVWRDIVAEGRLVHGRPLVSV